MAPIMFPISFRVLAVIALIAASACSKERSNDAADQTGTETAPVAATAPHAALPPSISSGVIGVTDVDPAGLHQVKTCFIDTINRQGLNLTAKAGTKATFSGWILDEGVHAPTEIAVALSGSSIVYAFKGVTTVERPDVARALKRPDIGRAGFNLSVRLDGIEAGRYAVLLLQPGKSGLLGCATQASVTIE